MYRIYKIWKPEIFQGKYKNTNYFEGWYYRLISKDQSTILSIIPGVSYDNAGEKHAFIQVIDGITGMTHYLRFPISEFQYSDKVFDIRIGNNHFTNQKISLHLESPQLFCKGDLVFYDRISYPKKILNPGIMGPFYFVPFMECYHGIVNIYHHLEGSLNYNNRTFDFRGGYGYIEKDWGSSFPKSWIWVQSNHFHLENVCMMFSIADIPWFHTSFIGFLCFIRLNNKHFTFTTYTGAKIKYLRYIEPRLSISIEDKSYKLTLDVQISPNAGELTAPKMGAMERKIKESITSTVEVTLKDKSDNLVFQGIGFHTGTEIAGNLTDLGIHKDEYTL